MNWQQFQSRLRQEISGEDPEVLALASSHQRMRLVLITAESPSIRIQWSHDLMRTWICLICLAFGRCQLLWRRMIKSNRQCVRCVQLDPRNMQCRPNDGSAKSLNCCICRAKSSSRNLNRRKAAAGHTKLIVGCARNPQLKSPMQSVHVFGYVEGVEL